VRNLFLSEISNTPMLVQKPWLDSIRDIILSKPESQDAKDISAFSDYEEETTKATNVTRSGSIAILNISGPIFAKENFYTRYLGAVNSTKVLASLKSLEANPEITDVVIVYDTPGGMVNMTHTVANQIHKMAENPEINMVSYVSGMAASAGYWFASQANKIYMEETASVGSIGVVCSVPKKDDKDSWYVTITNSDSPNKRPDPETKEGKQSILTEIDDLALIFQETVARGRGVTLEKVKNDFGKGAMLVGKRAVEVGMADEICSFDDMITSLQKQKTNSKRGASASVNTNSRTEENAMDLTELKAKHPELYAQAVAAGKTEVEATIASAQAKLDAAIEQANATAAENAALKAAAASATADSTTAAERLAALEEKNAARDAADLAKTATDMFSASLVGSGIPKGIQKKVPCPDHKAFVTNGVFDATGFQAAVAAEVKDWEGTFASISPVGGIVPVADPAVSTAAAVTDISDSADADRLAGFLNLSKKEA